MSKYPQTNINVKVNRNFNLETSKKVQDAISHAEAELLNKGRIVLRASGTEPVIRVMVEGKNRDQIDIIAKQLAGVVAEFAS